MSKLTIPVILSAATFSAPAFAGGVGIMGSGGLHEAKAYYYDNLGRQGIDTQQRPNAGFGAEVLLGDKDDRIMGLMRIYSNVDWPTNEPTLSGVDPEDATYPAAHLEAPRLDGTISMGVQWGLWGDPTGFQLIGTTVFGSAFITPDNLEYLIAEAGVGGTYMLNERFQLAGTVAFAGRFRKQVTLSEGAFVSARYMFD
jgi:hypothetical protein